LVDLGGGRGGVIAWLRRFLGSALGRSSAESLPAQASVQAEEFDHRLEAARERLKAAIPPRED
jgi:hypothetical protein